MQIARGLLNLRVLGRLSHLEGLARRVDSLVSFYSKKARVQKRGARSLVSLNKNSGHERVLETAEGHPRNCYELSYFWELFA